METEYDIKKLQELLQKDPSNFQARRELAITLADNGFNDEALANLLYLEKYFQEDADLQYNIGILYEKLKNLEDAKKAYQKAVSISPQEDFYYNLGEVLVSLSEWDEAIEVFNQVLETDKNDGNCYFNLGICYLNKEDENKATDYLQKAIELNPDDLFAHFYLGNIYQNKGLTNFAEECYKKVLDISPDYSWAYYNLASIAYQNGNIDEAKEYLQKTIQYNETDIEAYKLLIKIFIKENNYEEALSLLNTRLEKEENGDLFYILAQIYKRLEQEEEYATSLENALKNNLTLTYQKNIVKKEYEKINSKLGNIERKDNYELREEEEKESLEKVNDEVNYNEDDDDYDEVDEEQYEDESYDYTEDDIDEEEYTEENE